MYQRRPSHAKKRSKSTCRSITAQERGMPSSLTPVASLVYELQLFNFLHDTTQHICSSLCSCNNLNFGRSLSRPLFSVLISSPRRQGHFRVQAPTPAWLEDKPLRGKIVTILLVNSRTRKDNYHLRGWPPDLRPELSQNSHS